MKILFTSGLGIRPEQRIKRWQMVTDLYVDLGKAFRAMGHQIYYIIHPEALTESVPRKFLLTDTGHEGMDYIMQKFQPDFVFCWNGSSEGDIATTTLACSYGAKMVYSEQGWFPQKSTLYFDFNGCNGRCSTKGKLYPEITTEQEEKLINFRTNYLKELNIPGETIYSRGNKTSKKLFIPLQDERDLNIILDSPFKTMYDFLNHILENFEDFELIVRPHPKYPSPRLPESQSIKLQNPKEPMHKQLKQCKAVIGINSTTLLESRLLEYPVISYGMGLGSGTGTFKDANINDEINLDKLNLNEKHAKAFLFHLSRKQFYRKDLKKHQKVISSQLFNNLITNASWKTINR